MGMLAGAGCLDLSDGDGGTSLGDAAGGDGPLADGLPRFDPPVIIDQVRAGGEPVIAITHAGTILVSAHPGYTHYHTGDPSDPPTEVILPSSLQSYLWRSTDNGTTWTHIGLPGSTEGPRSAGWGVSDPEFTVMQDGTICYTDLLALASSSVACSQDDGQTWLPGNPVASGGPNDRQWLASHGEELYFTANYFANHRVRASTDKGLTWEDRGDVPCDQDLVADPGTGHLVVGCTPSRDVRTLGIAVSPDGGLSWAERPIEGLEGGGQRVMAEPAIDSDGNIWVAVTRDEDAVLVAGTPDEGQTWPWVIDVTPAAVAGWQHDGFETSGNTTFVWPWVSAGSAGRVAVTWIGSASDADSGEQSGPWHMWTAFILEADTADPTVVVTRLTQSPMHTAPICQDGTTCQVTSMAGRPAGDRRLGDFFETTIGPDGFLYAAWSNTAATPDDVVSHPEFVRQVGGVRLIEDELVGRFVPTQG